RPTPAETCPERWPTNVIRAPFVFVLPRGLSVPDESLFGFFSALFRPAARPSDPLPTWGRPPSAVRAERSSASESRYSLAPAPLYPCPRGDGRPRPSGRSAAPLPKHDIRSPAPRFTHVHVGTAALGRPGGAQLRFQNTIFARPRPALPWPTWGRPPNTRAISSRCRA